MPQLSIVCKRRLTAALTSIKTNKLSKHFNKDELACYETAKELDSKLTPKIMTIDMDVNKYTKLQSNLLNHTNSLEDLVRKYNN